MRLGEEDGVRKVGYLATTHLQVFQGTSLVDARSLAISCNEKNR